MYSMNPRYAITQATQIQMRSRGGWEYTQGKANKEDKKHFIISAVQRMNFPLPSHGSRTPKRDNENQILDTMLAGAIIARMDAQREPIKSWLWFAYGAWFYDTHQRQLETALMRLYDGDSNKKRRKWEHLVRMALFDWRNEVWGRGRFRKVLIFSTVGVNKQSYYKHWQKHYRNITAVIHEWDLYGIGAIDGLLHDYVEPMQYGDDQDAG